MRARQGAKRAVVMLIIAAFAITPTAATADDDGSTIAPLPGQELLPAVNAASFELFPPGWPLMSDSLGTAAADPQIAVSASRRSRRLGRRARAATRPGLVACGGYAIIGKPTGTSVSADGVANCAPGQSGGSADLLGALACIDVWSTGGYWTRLNCGDSWNSCAACRSVGAYTYRRQCTIARYYRAVLIMSMVHGNNARGDYPSGYRQC